jgi:hypothetical protein
MKFLTRIMTAILFMSVVAGNMQAQGFLDRVRGLYNKSITTISDLRNKLPSMQEVRSYSNSAISAVSEKVNAQIQKYPQVASALSNVQEKAVSAKNSLAKIAQDHPTATKIAGAVAIAAIAGYLYKSYKSPKRQIKILEKIGNKLAQDLNTLNLAINKNINVKIDVRPAMKYAQKLNNGVHKNAIIAALNAYNETVANYNPQNLQKVISSSTEVRRVMGIYLGELQKQ